MKNLKILAVLLLVISLQGCTFDSPKYIHSTEKKYDNFYTKEIYSKLLQDNNYTLEILDTNLYKSYQIDDNENDVIENFIRSLSTDNFKSNEKIEEIAPYEMKIKFDDKSKYLIKVYNNSTVSISPWDGIYPEDIIDMTDIPLKFNLFDFCKHIENMPRLNQ